MRFLAPLEERFLSSQYTQLRHEELPQNSCEKHEVYQNETLGALRLPLAILWAITVIVAGLIGSYAGTQSRYRQSMLQNSCLKGIISDPSGQRCYLFAPAVTDDTQTIFQYNSSFAAAPRNATMSEPIWDSLIPSQFPVSSVLCLGS